MATTFSFRLRSTGLPLNWLREAKLSKDGKQGRDRQEAKNQESFWKTQLLMSKVQSEKDRTLTDLTFGDWADAYLAMDAVQALRTYQHRKISVERFKRLFGNKRLSDLSTDDVEHLRAVRRGEGKATSMINNDHAALTHIPSIAVARDRLIVNVASKVPLTNPENERDRVLTIDEWDRLYSRLPDHLSDFVLIAYEVGVRRGELRKLCWPQVDLSSRTFKILGVNAKNKRERLVPMTENVNKAFTRLAKQKLPNINAVFTYKGKSLSPECLRMGI
jgi:integrase